MPTGKRCPVEFATGQFQRITTMRPNRISFMAVAMLWSASGLAADNWLRFEAVAGALVVPATIAGEPVRLGIDTLSPFLLVDEAFVVARLQRVARGRAREYCRAQQCIESPRLSNVPLQLDKLRITLRDVLLMPELEQEVNAGYALLEQAILQIDFARSSLRLLAHDALALGSSANLDLRRDRYSEQPMLRAVLPDGRDAWLLLDIGGDQSTLTQRLDAAYLEAQDSGDTQMSLRELRLGPYAIESLRMQRGKPRFARRATTLAPATSASGSLGRAALAPFVLTLDLRHGLAHIGLSEPANAD